MSREGSVVGAAGAARGHAQSVMTGSRTAHPVMPISGTAWNGVVYGCTTRHGGFSKGPWSDFNLATHVDDVPEHVARNRLSLMREGGLPSAPFWLDQVHGVDVADADIVCAGGAPTHIPKADAAITQKSGRVLAIMTADCVPVVLADLDGKVLGVAHAGWRGLVGGVVEATLAALRAKRPSARGWRAWVGPCIGQAAFEVGEEVRAAFLEADAGTAGFFLPGKAAGKWYADLAGLTRHRLVSAGVLSVEVAGLCTYDHDALFFSYRRHPVTGRMATLAWLDGLPTFPD